MRNIVREFRPGINPGPTQFFYERAVSRWTPAIVLALFFGGGCSPASPTRIGPSIPPRSSDCEIDIMPPGEKPTRPYRDVGQVALENCPDFRTQPCRGWLRKAACELGGQIAYDMEKSRPQSDIPNKINYRVMVAVYVSDLPYSNEDDPLYKAMTCDPPCGEKERCKDGKCVPLPEEDCEEEAVKAMEQGTEGPERCLE